MWPAVLSGTLRGSALLPLQQPGWWNVAYIKLMYIKFAHGKKLRRITGILEFIEIK